MIIRKALLAGAVSAVLAGCSSSSDETITPETDTNLLELTVAHINDTHSYFDPREGNFRTEIYKADGESADTTVEEKIYTDFGGFPRLKSKLDTLRAEAQADNRNFLTLHGGDAFQGTLYFTLNKGKANAQLLNDMGIDAMAAGNHEFDLGNEVLADFASSINFPILAANAVVADGDPLSGNDNFIRYIVKSYGEEKVGIFGLALEKLPSVSSPAATTTFSNEITGAQKMVDEFKGMGINKVIMVSHIGLDRDRLVAEGVNGIDLIVGGHSHTLLGDFTNLGLNDNGPYAEQVTNLDGEGKTCIVQAGQYAEGVGVVNVAFTDSGELDSCQGGNTLLVGDRFKHKYNGDVKVALRAEHKPVVESFIDEQSNIEVVQEDTVMRDDIDTLYKPGLADFEKEIAGEVTEKLDHVRVPGQSRPDADELHPVTGSEIAAHVARSILHLLRKANYDVDLSIQNAGGVRVSVPEGEITKGFVVGTLLPFSNSLAVFDMTGANIRSTLEAAIDNATNNGVEGTGTGSFPYTGDLRYTYVADNAQGSRMTRLEINDEGVWVDLEDAETYSVAANSFIAAGRDSYTGLLTRENYVDTGFVDNDAFLSYMEMLTDDNKELESPIDTNVEYFAPVAAP
ncbi:MAG: bifunctional metallophosphatase/5'-nucleotidase [Endozoicomonas sp.]